jgi:hypothetical protein
LVGLGLQLCMKCSGRVEAKNAKEDFEIV